MPLVIVAYKPKPGKETELENCVRGHMAPLRQLGLVTDRIPIICRAKDGTLIEIFEWKSQAAIDQAHREPLVHKMWAEFGACCDMLPVGQVPEAMQLFSQFEAFG